MRKISYGIGFLLFISTVTSISLSSFRAEEIENELSHKQEKFLINKAFYLLEALNSNSTIRSAVKGNALLAQISSAKKTKIEAALKACQDVSCISEAVKWSDQEIDAVSNEFLKLYDSNSSFRAVASLLKKEGKYKLFEKDGRTLISKAWKQDAAGINKVLTTYIEGKKPLYPKIDAISFEGNDAAFKEAVIESVSEISKEHRSGLFFEIPLYSALSALAMNGRDEAVRYEPLNKGLNKAPSAKAKKADWPKYKYSLILVPGLGPEVEGVALDPNGALRCRLAAERYHKGLAPFIAVSGGHVHPNKTPFNEAVEMKNYMVDSLKIPASVIFIEPHARHTTTNIRNVNRMIYRFGLPASKPVMTVTDASQSKGILGMDKRLMTELGAVPYKKMQKISDLENEYYPDSTSLQINSMDILDP